MSTNPKNKKISGGEMSVESWSGLKFVCCVEFWQPPPPLGCCLTVLLRFWGSKSTFMTLALFEVWTRGEVSRFLQLPLLRFFTVGGGHFLLNAQLRVSKYYRIIIIISDTWHFATLHLESRILDFGLWTLDLEIFPQCVSLHTFWQEIWRDMSKGKPSI